MEMEGFCLFLYTYISWRKGRTATWFSIIYRMNKECSQCLDYDRLWCLHWECIEVHRNNSLSISQKINQGPQYPLTCQKAIIPCLERHVTMLILLLLLLLLLFCHWFGGMKCFKGRNGRPCIPSLLFKTSQAKNLKIATESWCEGVQTIYWRP